MTEPANVTTESGAAADGETTAEDAATSSAHGDPATPAHGPDDPGGDADLVAEH